jgi:hypothetical protein
MGNISSKIWEAYYRIWFGKSVYLEYFPSTLINFRVGIISLNFFNASIY